MGREEDKGKIFKMLRLWRRMFEFWVLVEVSERGGDLEFFIGEGMEKDLGVFIGF